MQQRAAPGSDLAGELRALLSRAGVGPAGSFLRGCSGQVISAEPDRPTPWGGPGGSYGVEWRRGRLHKAWVTCSYCPLNRRQPKPALRGAELGEGGKEGGNRPRTR